MSQGSNLLALGVLAAIVVPLAAIGAALVAPDLRSHLQAHLQRWRAGREMRRCIRASIRDIERREEARMWQSPPHRVPPGAAPAEQQERRP